MAIANGIFDCQACKGSAACGAQDALGRAAAAMADYQATRPLAPGEAAQAAAAAEALVGVVCPYAVACLGRIFPGAAGRVDLRAATLPLAPDPLMLGSLGSGLGSDGNAAGKAEARRLGEAQAPPAQQPAPGRDPGGAAGDAAAPVAAGPVARGGAAGSGAGSSGSSRDPPATAS